MMRLRISSLGACRLTARATGNACASLRMLGTTPEVESVTRRRERPYARSSSMIDIASTTGWKLLSGSPIPIITTLLTGLGERVSRASGPAPSASRREGIPSLSISSRRLFATHSCPMISPADRSRLKPWRPVEQNLQSRAQPTCEDTQSVPRSSSGMKTVSIPFPIPTSKSHFTVPSAERCSERIEGGRTSAMPFSFSRRDFARSVMASKSATPRWWIHWKSWRARNGFSPRSASQSVSWGCVKARRLARSVIRLFGNSSGLAHRPLREEVGDLDLGGLRRVAAVHGIGVDGLREVGADGALGGLLRIGGAHEVAVPEDRVLAFEHLDHHRARAHEFDEVVEERAALVDRVEALGILARQ